MHLKSHFCIVLSLWAMAITSDATAGGEQSDLATIRASLEALRESAGIRHVKYSLSSRILKGSQNVFLDPPRKIGQGADVPGEDIVVELPPTGALMTFAAIDVGRRVRTSRAKSRGTRTGRKFLPPFWFSAKRPLMERKGYPFRPRNELTPGHFLGT